MTTHVFGLHEGLRTATRFPAIDRPSQSISRLETATLLGAGAVAAAATGMVRLGLTIPGSAIVMAVLPMALGLALVPRRLAGVIMAGGAFSTALALSGAGLARYGSGAMTSLCLTGPLLDLAVAGAGSGSRLYGALILAGMASNVAAFLQRAASKVLLLDGPGTRPFATWWPQALVTYALCGAAAGGVAAILWFEFQRPPPGSRRRGLHRDRRH